MTYNESISDVVYRMSDVMEDALEKEIPPKEEIMVNQKQAFRVNFNIGVFEMV